LKHGLNFIGKTGTEACKNIPIYFYSACVLWSSASGPRKMGGGLLCSLLCKQRAADSSYAEDISI